MKGDEVVMNIIMPDDNDPYRAGVEYGRKAALSEVEKIIKARIIKCRPTHGECCTCQTCGQPHDECACDENNIYESLLSAISKLKGE